MNRHPVTFILATCAAVLALISPLAAATGDPIGAATTVKNQVSAAFEADNRDLSIGDNVYQNELIEVGDDSIGELVLNDDTMLALGAGSKLLLDKFVYNGEKKSGDVLLDIVRGTFRFITGSAAKRSYRIRTPSAAITVRGTIFDVYAAPDGAIWLLLLEGGVRACSDRGDCEDLDKPGLLIRAKPDGTIDKPAQWASLAGGLDFAAAFPFMFNAPNIDPNPVLSSDDVLNQKGPSKSTPKKKTYKKKKSTPKKKATKEPTKKVYKSKPKKYVKKKYKPKRKKNASAGNSVVPAIVGIGVGIAIGKALKKKKHNHHPKPCRGHKCY